MKYFLNKKGFTLIELLVVIAIIGILTAIVTANLSGAKAKARDAKRISDLSQIQLALEMAFDRCNVYPPDINSGDTKINGILCVDSSGNPYTISYFISRIPSPPLSGDAYTYTPGTGYVDYKLQTVLETANSALNEGCSSGQTYCVEPK
jgi:prepilin-type N-terminal cleavage/methylation domain-containing protein